MQAEHRPLFVCLPEQPKKPVGTPTNLRTCSHCHVDILGGAQVKYYRDKVSVLDPLATSWRVVDRHRRPKSLTHLKASPGRLKPIDDLLDLVGQEACDSGAENAGKLGLQQVAKGAVGRLAGAGGVRRRVRVRA